MINGFGESIRIQCIIHGCAHKGRHHFGSERVSRKSEEDACFEALKLLPMTTKRCKPKTYQE